MENMNPHKRLLAVVLALAALLAVALVRVASAGQDSRHDDEAQVVAPQRGSYNLPKLFDFQEYQRLFKKRYTGLVETMMRAKLFTARAFRVFISAIKYKHYQETYYLSVNHLSDLSHEELERMRNKAFERATLAKSPAHASPIQEEEPPEIMEGNGMQTTTIEANTEQPVMRLRRRKRNARTDRKRRPRELPFDKLINLGNGVDLPAAAKAKIPSTVKSNNRNYKRAELMSMGLIDQQESVKNWYMGPPLRVREASPSKEDLKKEGASSSSTDGFDHSKVGEALYPRQSSLPDQVFSDLRTFDCFFLPRDQGKCGSCYAFAAVAVMEYFHCMKIGKLLAFSEQYIIDCGKEYLPDIINGCGGGFTHMTAHFFQNFGMELRANYPYQMREQQCPYPPETDLRTTGYIRTDIKNTIQFHERHWHMVLERQPLLVNAKITSDFFEYGGGVHGWGCGVGEAAHTMVLVGHGREDGHEYWLARNSHGLGWGHVGHWKVAKSADCFFDRVGALFGTMDGKTQKTLLGKNARYASDLVKQRYMYNMMHS